MRRRTLGGLCAILLFAQGGWAMAQSSIDALEAELKEAKQQRDDTSTQIMTGFFGQVDPAMASPDAALALFEQAGGFPPDPSPVITEHESETPTEKQTRLALDQANLARLSVVLQLQCGLLHFGALFVTKPDQPGLPAAWQEWLKSAAQLYVQTGVPSVPGEPAAPVPHKKRERDRERSRADADTDAAPVKQVTPPFNPVEQKSRPIKDSLINKFLTFNGWGDKDQGGWTVKGIPALYRAAVLDPLRTPPSVTTLAAWDAYIAMANADESDNDKWNQVDYPPLQFERACDDYAISPSTEKIEGLIALAKANAANPQSADWFDRVRAFLDDYKSHHGGAPSSAPVAATNAPAGTPPAPAVTTTVQGDMTIVTTHSNAAPVSPTPPQ